MSKYYSILCVFILLLSGCGSSDEGGSSGSGGTPADVQNDTGTDTTTMEGSSDAGSGSGSGGSDASSSTTEPTEPTEPSGGGSDDTTDTLEPDGDPTGDSAVPGDQSANPAPAAAPDAATSFSGGPPPGRSPFDNTESLEFDFSSFAGAGGSQVQTPSYFDQAIEAFNTGDEVRAYEMLLFNMVAEPERAGKAYQSVRWSPSSRRPRWMLRIGIAVNNAAVRHGGDLMPVREGMSDPSGTRNAGGGTGLSGGGRNNNNTVAFVPNHDVEVGDPVSEIDRYSGLIGRVVGDMFVENMDKFAPAFEGVGSVPVAAAAPANNNHNDQDLFGGDTMEMSMEGDMSGPPGSGGSGPPGMGPPGSGGSGPPGMRQPGAGRPGAGRPAAPAAVGVGGGNPGRFRPGLIYLGAGHPKSILAAAQEQDLDAYLQIDVSVPKVGTTNRVNNDTSVKWIFVANGKPLKACEKLNNIKVFNASERGRSIDQQVREAVSVLFNNNPLALQPMIQISAEQAMDRIAGLIRTPPSNPLVALAEVRLYHSKGLITDDQVHQAFDFLMGDRGLILSAGTAQSRAEQLNAALSDQATF